MTIKTFSGSSGGGGSGTVTSVSVVSANGVTGTVANPTTTPAITLNVGASTKAVNQNGHGFSVWQAVIFNGTAYVAAQADSAADAEVVGLVSTVTDANNFVITTGGYISSGTTHGLTASQVGFLSPTTPGALTATAPTTVGQISKPLLIADSTTSGYLVNFRGEVLASAQNANILVGRASTFVASVGTGSTQIPADDTPPQNNEGDQYLSLTYTPANAANILVIQASVAISCSLANTITAALFQSGNVNAIAATADQLTSNGQVLSMSFAGFMTAGTTSSITFTVRIGAGGSGTVTFNGTGGARRYGGVSASSLLITEYTS